MLYKKKSCNKNMKRIHVYLLFEVVEEMKFEER